MLTNILVTGGAGFIGSHTTLSLLEAGYKVAVLDNLSNSSFASVRRIQNISKKSLSFIEGDVRDQQLLKRIFNEFNISAVIHFAGLKAVSESVAHPLRYYENNISGTLTLCQAMAEAGVFNLVFSSSATVYGDPDYLPIDETHKTGQTTNPYGRSKWIVEQILSDLSASDARWRLAILRYFNPIGAHSSGLIGEAPNGIPNNLLPFLAQVAAGKRDELTIYGNDYDTIDGTGVRDYIHVVDLAQGHLDALNALDFQFGCRVWNLGTGKGYTVLEVVKAFETISGSPIPIRFAARRAGDIASCYANIEKAKLELNWTAKLELNNMIEDLWRWQLMNPNGYYNSQDQC
jgi:UDP-glucose 4-epimerase